MKSPQTFYALLLALACSGLNGCGSGYLILPTPVVTPVSVSFYSIDAVHNVILQFVTDGSGSARQNGTITLPAGLNASLVTTDAKGNLYVGGYTTNVNTTEVVVYTAGATGSAVPVRTVLLESGKLTALAVSSAGQIYAGQLNVSGSVKVYSATANGASSASRTVSPSNLLYVDDVAVDSAGNTYVSAYNGGAYLISEYDPAATGAATPLRTLIAPASSYFGGLSVDDNGTVYVMEQLTIVRFAPGATGTPAPASSINLPAPQAPYTTEAYPDILRRDAGGNFYVPVALGNAGAGTTPATLNLVYGFAAGASGSAAPIVQFKATDATVSNPLGTHIPLAVF